MMAFSYLIEIAGSSSGMISQVDLVCFVALPAST